LKVTKAPFGQISRELSNEFQPNLAGTYYGKCPLCRSNPDLRGQRSRSHRVEVRFGGLAEEE